MKKIKYVYAAFLATVMMITGTVSAKAYLEGISYNAWPMSWSAEKTANIKLYDNVAGKYVADKDRTIETPNVFYFNNSSKFASSDYTLYFGSNDDCFQIPLLFDVYDYYIAFSLYGVTSDDSEFTFKPSKFSIVTYDHDRNMVYNYLDFKNYCYCNATRNGFTTIAPLTELNNLAISYVCAEGTGTIAQNSYIRGMIFEIPKSTSGGSDNSAAIIEAIASMEQTLNQSILDGFSSLSEQSQTQHNETLHGYEDNTLNEANNRFTEGADELTAVEDGLTTDSKQYVNDFTSTGFDAGVLLTLGSSLTFIVTWFTNFWNMGGVWTSGLTFCFALSIAFIILKVRK